MLEKVADEERSDEVLHMLQFFRPVTAILFALLSVACAHLLFRWMSSTVSLLPPLPLLACVALWGV